MRSSLVVRASDCQCTSCNGPGFDPSIRRHSGIWGAADETVLNIVWKNRKNPSKKYKKKLFRSWGGSCRLVVRTSCVCILIWNLCAVAAPVPTQGNNLIGSGGFQQASVSRKCYKIDFLDWILCLCFWVTCWSLGGQSGEIWGKRRWTPHMWSSKPQTQ